MCCRSVYVRIRTDVFHTSGIWSVVVRFPWSSPIRFSHRFEMLTSSVLICSISPGDVYERLPHSRSTIPVPHSRIKLSRRRHISLHRRGFFESTASVCLHPVSWMLGVQIVVPTNIRFWMKIQTYWGSSNRNLPPHHHCRLYRPAETFRRDVLFNHIIHVMIKLHVFANKTRYVPAICAGTERGFHPFHRVLQGIFSQVFTLRLQLLHLPLWLSCICNVRSFRRIHNPWYSTSFHVLEDCGVRYGNKLP